MRSMAGMRSIGMSFLDIECVVIIRGNEEGTKFSFYYSSFFRVSLRKV